MKFNKLLILLCYKRNLFSFIIILLISLITIMGCGGSDSGSVSPNPPPVKLPNGASLPVLTGANIIPLSVNGASCTNAYPNKPCISIQVCTSGTSTCQTITDVLVDTGSYGLRVFKSLLTIAPNQVTSGGKSVAECAQFGDGSSLWGPVETVDIILGGEPAVTVPIQVIDASFNTPPSSCSKAFTKPSSAGFNAILGVGLFAQDCGNACVGLSNVNNGMYYTCSGGSCAGTAVTLSQQLTNPVSLLPNDNNGVILELPSLPNGDVTAINGGYMVLGIGTQSNNKPDGTIVAYFANKTGEFTTQFNGNTYNGIVDSGSNGFFFTSPSSNQLPTCSAPNTTWFCPSSVASLSATTISSTGSPSGKVSFQIENFNTFAGSSNNVSTEIGGNAVGNLFTWGMSFYIGRNVYIGIDKTLSPLGTGPYWGY